jgi:hypothetical protein
MRGHDGPLISIQGSEMFGEQSAHSTTPVVGSLLVPLYGGHR